MEIPTGVATLIGLAGLPFIAVMVVQHVKQAMSAAWLAIRQYRGMGYQTDGNASPYPLIRDAVCIGGAWLVRESGGFSEVLTAGAADNISTVILVGLAVSFIAGQLHDRLPALTATR